MNSDMNIAAENAPGTPKVLQAKTRKRTKREWLVPIGLLLLSLVPVLAGAARIAELSSGAEITTNNARFFASPIPVVAHIISVTLYSLLGAIQFVPSLRNKKIGWRLAGTAMLDDSLFPVDWLPHFQVFG